MDSETTLGQKRYVVLYLDTHGVKIQQHLVNKLTLDQLKRIRKIIDEK